MNNVIVDMDNCVGFHIHKIPTGYDVYFGKKINNRELRLKSAYSIADTYSAIMWSNSFLNTSTSRSNSDDPNSINNNYISGSTTYVFMADDMKIESFIFNENQYKEFNNFSIDIPDDDFVKDDNGDVIKYTYNAPPNDNLIISDIFNIASSLDAWTFEIKKNVDEYEVKFVNKKNINFKIKELNINHILFYPQEINYDEYSKFHSLKIMITCDIIIA